MNPANIEKFFTVEVLPPVLGHAIRFFEVEVGQSNLEGGQAAIIEISTYNDSLDLYLAQVTRDALTHCGWKEVVLEEIEDKEAVAVPLVSEVKGQC